MLFDRLGPAWNEYKGGLEKELQVLIVDDEPVICTILRELLEAEGFWVKTALDAEAAWEDIQHHAFDLMVVDKNLGGTSGLDLIRQVRDDGIDLPSIVITGYPSVESINKALMHGATDYIQKPFQLPRVLHRIKTVVHRRVAERVYSLIVQDLSNAVRSSGEDREAVQAIAADLSAFKQSLAARPSVIVAEPNSTLSELTLAAISMRGLEVKICQDLDQARRALHEPEGPLVGVVNLKLPNVVDFIHEIRAHDPELEIFVTSTAADVEIAQRVIEAGAADFFERTVEGVDVLQARVSRLVRRTRRQRLYNYLIATLLQQAEEQGHAIAQTLRAILPESAPTERPSVEPMPVVVGQAVDISELFEEPVDRRQHPRLPVHRSVTLHALREEASFPGETRDMSLGGMFVVCERAPSLGSRFMVEIAPVSPEEAGVSVSVEIVRHVQLGADAEGRTGLGMRVLGQLETYHGMVCQLLDT